MNLPSPTPGYYSPQRLERAVIKALLEQIFPAPEEYPVELCEPRRAEYVAAVHELTTKKVLPAGTGSTQA